MAMASTDWAESGHPCRWRRAAIAAALGLGLACGACSQSVSSGLPELQPVNNVLTADQQKKAIDDLQARRDQQEADSRQQAKIQR